MDTFLVYISEKIRLGISFELFARQMILLKCQVLFSLKSNNNKKKNENAIAYFLWKNKKNIVNFSSAEFAR